MENDHFEILLEEMKSNFQLAFEGLDGQEVIKSDVRDIKRNMGLLNSIANDHESRIQGVESKLKDHLENHS